LETNVYDCPFHSPRWVRRFYLQRLFRIYPLSIVCVFVVLLCAVPPNWGTPFAQVSIGGLLANLTLTQNLTRVDSVSASMWTLPFETQMYLLLPAVFLFCQKYGRSGSLILVAASIVLAAAESAVPGPHVMQFFPCFLGGALAYTMRKRKPTLPAVAFPLTLAFFAIGGAAQGMSTLAQWGICIVLGGALPLFQEIRAGAIASASAWVARYSYGIYLSNLPLRWLCFERFHLSLWQAWALYAVLISILPMALYHFIEAPMIRFGREGFKAWKSSHCCLVVRTGWPCLRWWVSGPSGS
jgi:peptidoglycan/LPS O-acetylase OafA/YrhL